ncbi:class I SAM-dependent methyltransferase [Acidithiobacillus sp. M4-SHS-6]|uniref:class I SAM-dependent methyltransferase n=1 Tax=Acidithiobacillus sp. M4-SHS-6 TaxID=3383024 RepID=UPI0039BDB3CA
MADPAFYRAFEDRHRGSRELIKNRVRVYLPFLYPLRALYPDGVVLDLGCGRGEWLQLLRDEGFAAHGVDQDVGMLSACASLGLRTERRDMLETLRSQPEASFMVVTGFHIAEHVPFPVLQELVAEALRVLKPAGLLILETPNAENLVVGSSSFYLDPTHQRPLPPLLLAFLTEYAGFLRNKILRLQESPDLTAPDAPVSLLQVLAGVSPDYAVVAQKEAAPADLARLDAPFAQEYGLTLADLAARYEAHLREEILRELKPRRKKPAAKGTDADETPKK